MRAETKAKTKNTQSPFSLFVARSVRRPGAGSTQRESSGALGAPVPPPSRLWSWRANEGRGGGIKSRRTKLNSGATLKPIQSASLAAGRAPKSGPTNPLNRARRVERDPFESVSGPVVAPWLARPAARLCRKRALAGRAQKEAPKSGGPEGRPLSAKTISTSAKVPTKLPLRPGAVRRAGWRASGHLRNVRDDRFRLES